MTLLFSVISYIPPASIDAWTNTVRFLIYDYSLGSFRKIITVQHTTNHNIIQPAAFESLHSAKGILCGPGTGAKP